MAELRRAKLEPRAVTRLRAAIYAASVAMEAAKQTEYGDQLDELTKAMDEMRETQKASDMKATHRKAGTLPPWERAELVER